MAKKSKDTESGFKVLAQNKKAYHDFHITDKYEAGMVLTGSEIKSIRNGGVVLKDGFVRVRGGQMFLESATIAKYKQGGKFYNHEPDRPRKLLLHKREIAAIDGSVSKKGLTLLPLRMYLKGNRAKLEIGLAKSKKNYDKKQDIMNREAQLEDGREMKRLSRRTDLKNI